MEEEIKELYESLEERERNIDELEAVLTNLEGENDKQQDELNARSNELQELQLVVKQLRLVNNELLEEKTLLVEKVDAQKSQLDAQKNVLSLSAKATEEAKKVQKDGNQNLYRLEVENQRLRDTILQIEENDGILVNEIETLIRQKSDYQQQSEESTSKCDKLHADIDEKARTISALQHEKEIAESDLLTSGEEYRNNLVEWQRKDAANKSEITRLLSELEQERAKHKESALVKENDAFRKELTQIRKENQRLNSLHDRCLMDKNQAERDLDEAIQALSQSKRDAQEHIASKLLKEKADTTQANAKVDIANAKLESATQRCLDAEEKLEHLRNQLRCSNERNALYEKNNGLVEVVCSLKQLEADVRRRDYDLKRLNHALGVEMDKRRALSKACDWLKEKADVGPDFTFDDEEIKTALECEDSRLQSENAELSRQIESLEVERTKLLMQLRERAIDLGEKGGRFLGMNPQQVDTVMEFASNLRRGLVQLPLNDRSKELLAEISALKSEKEVQRVAIAGLEREISTRESPSESPSEGESNVLKSENQKLTGEIATLKAGRAIDHASSVLTPLMRERVKEILGEDLVLMPPSAEVQFICAINAYDKISQELSSTKKLFEKHGFENGAHKIDRKSEPPVIDSACNSDISLNSKTSKNVGRRLAEESNDAISSVEESEEDLNPEANSGFGPGQTDEKKSAGLREAGLRFGQQVVCLCEEQMVTANDVVNRLTIKCKSLEDELTAVKKERQKDEFTEVKCMRDALDQAKQKLSVYVCDVKNLHLAVLSVEESRINSAKARKQISCLNDIIREKSRLYDALAARITKEGAGKKGTREHQSSRGNRENESDHSTSTNSIDRSISRAVSSSGHCSPSLKQKMQKHLEDSLRLITEKDNAIREQTQKIVELTEKLLLADESYQNLQKEADRMKIDMGEMDTAINQANVYQQKLVVAQDALDKVRAEISCLKDKERALVKEGAQKDAQIMDLLALEVRTKNFLSVARQGRARSEEIVKASNDEIASLKKSLEDMGARMNALKLDKIEAQNEKLKMSRKARESAIKLKSLTENENSKTVEELTKSVNVLNNTVSGLAAQNSSLRIALAECKQRIKVDADTSEQTTTTTRESMLREQRQSLKSQIKSLERSLAEEKRKKSDDPNSLERYQKRIIELENSLHQSARRNSAGDESQRGNSAEQVLSLTSENKSLRQKIDDLNRIKDTREKPDGNVDARLVRVKAENDALRRENERLSRIDHLDLFEEIEDLKTKYNEAVRQINNMTIS